MSIEQDGGKKRKHPENEGEPTMTETRSFGRMIVKEGRDAELRAVLNHQLELEIALRKRVAKVVEARIAWAEKLKESILSNQTARTTSDPVRAKRQAMGSFRALHAPLNLDPHTTHPRGSSILQTSNIPDQTPTQNTTASKQLYLVPPASESTPFPPLVLLSCPYPSCPTPHPSGTLQGLLNHARIAHGPSYAYSSQDEFLRAPGSSTLLDAVKEPEWYARVLAEGVRVKLGTVRGLRELFEGALGGAGLGFSAEMPELAGLLGRKVRKGEIRAIAQDEVVDVESIEEGPVERRKYGVWAPRRGKRRQEQEDETGVAQEPTRDPSVEPPRAPVPQQTHTSSRFHIKKRVVISDWSRSLRRADVQPGGPTHRWMIRLGAPSYSDHITTFLASVRVQCASVPPLFDDTISCSSPPFVVSRLSKDPFLARITLVFADERTKDVVITHWVDLDPLRGGNISLGAEQIFDVELDRNMQLLPENTSMDSIPNSILWSEDRGTSDNIVEKQEKELRPTVEEANAEPTIKSEPLEGDEQLANVLMDTQVEEKRDEPLHERLIPIVSKLRRRLPLTLEDARTGTTPEVPYMLFDTRSQLLEATHGRRKAIEWCYARAVLAMLQAEYTTYDADLDPKLVEGLGVSRLYAHLAAEKVFPRPEVHVSCVKLEDVTAAQEMVVETSIGPDQYCSSCGLNVRKHPPTTRALDSSGFACSVSTSFQRPICDIGLWTTLRPIREHIHRVNLTPGAITTHGVRASLRGASQLVECVHPQMTLALHDLTQSWGLKTFGYSAKRRNPATSVDRSGIVETKLPLEQLGVDASYVDRTLAPHALLALVAQVFVKRLTDEALRARAEMLRELSQTAGPSVLTAAHVSRALMDGRNSEGWLSLLSVARIGMLHTDSA